MQHNTLHQSRGRGGGGGGGGAYLRGESVNPHCHAPSLSRKKGECNSGTVSDKRDHSTPNVHSSYKRL